MSCAAVSRPPGAIARRRGAGSTDAARDGRARRRSAGYRGTAEWSRAAVGRDIRAGRPRRGRRRRRRRALGHAGRAVHARRAPAVTINGKWSGRTPLTRRRAAVRRLHGARRPCPAIRSKPEEVTLVGGRRVAHAVAAAAEGGPARRAGSRAATAPAAPAAPASRRGAPRRPGRRPECWRSIRVRPGRRVFVDDRAVGATPVRLPDVTPGSHTVRLELPEHRAWTEDAQVTRGKTTRVAGSLEPIR